MSNIENDETIRVNIRTGTSTRAPCPRNAEIPSYLDTDITIEFGDMPINSYQRMMSLMQLANMTNRGYVHTDDLIEEVIARSMNDSELKRDPTIRLDILSRPCSTCDVDEYCSVCQANFKLGEKLSTLHDCDHTFHHQCIQEWGKYKQECPLCRSAIPILER